MKKDERLSMRDDIQEDTRRWKSYTINLPEGAQLYKIDSTDKRKIDLIPFIVGKKHPKKKKGESAFFITFFTHRGIGPNNAVVLCPAKMAGKPCPICEESKRLLDEDDDSKIGKDLRPKVRQLFNVIDTEDRDSGIQIMDISESLFMDALKSADEALEDDDPRRFYADPKQGYTLKLTVSKNSGAGYTYYCVDRVDFIDRKKQYSKKIKKEAYCLDEILMKPLSYKKLKKLFYSEPEDDEEDNNESGGSSKKGKKKMAKKKGKKSKKVTAKDLGIKKGVECEHEDLEDVVVKKVSKDGTTCDCEDEDGDIHEDVPVSELTVKSKKSKSKSKKGKGKPKKSKSKKSKKEEEDDDEDDDDDDDDDDEDDEDEDDDEEDDDDEEEDDDEDDDDDDEDDDDDDDDDEDDDEDEDDEDEDDEPKSKKSKSKSKKGKKGKK